MELHQVRYFLALCEEKNFTRAAKHCGVSQPSLSNAIKRLEQELGGQLFHRNRLSCRLSELGQEVWPHLAQLDQCVWDARRQAARFLTAPRVTDSLSIKSVGVDVSQLHQNVKNLPVEKFHDTSLVFGGGD